MLAEAYNRATTEGILALVVGVWGITLMIGFIESKVTFWSVVWFAAFMTAGGLSMALQLVIDALMDTPSLAVSTYQWR